MPRRPSFEVLFYEDRHGVMQAQVQNPDGSRDAPVPLEIITKGLYRLPASDFARELKKFFNRGDLL